MRLHRVHRRAGEILSACGNRLLLVEALAILLLFVVMYSSVSYACAALLFLALDSEVLLLAVTGAHTLVTLLLTVLFVAPTVLGAFRIAYQMTIEEPVALADLFFAFSSRRAYFRALHVVKHLFWRVALVWLACEFTYLLFVYLIPPVSGIELVCGLLIGIEVLIGVIVLLRRYPDFYAAFQNEDLPLPRARARVSMETPVLRGGSFLLSFFPSIALGLFTVGIFWIADTLPRMLIAYFVDCKEVLGEKEKLL